MSPDNSQADVDYLPGSRSDREVSVHEAKVARKSISSGRKSRTRAIHRSVFPDTMVVTLLDFVDNHLDAYSNYKDCCKDARHVLIESYQDEQIPTTTQIYNKLVGMFRIYGRKDDLEEGETVPHRIWTRGRAAFPKLPAQMRSKPEVCQFYDLCHLALYLIVTRAPSRSTMQSRTTAHASFRLSQDTLTASTQQSQIQYRSLASQFNCHIPHSCRGVLQSDLIRRYWRPKPCVLAD